MRNNSHCISHGCITQNHHQHQPATILGHPLAQMFREERHSRSSSDKKEQKDSRDRDTRPVISASLPTPFCVRACIQSCGNPVFRAGHQHTPARLRNDMDAAHTNTHPASTASKGCGPHQHTSHRGILKWRQAFHTTHRSAWNPNGHVKPVMQKCNQILSV